MLSAGLFTREVRKARHAALALELFHNFTLLHDDIMDNAPLRRGFPTVHEKWDVNRAILSGDAIFVLAQQLFLKTRTKHLKKILEIFQKASLEVCEGQMVDLDFEKKKYGEHPGAYENDPHENGRTHRRLIGDRRPDRGRFAGAGAADVPVWPGLRHGVPAPGRPARCVRVRKKVRQTDRGRYSFG